MNHYSIKKINTGEQYEEENGNKYMLLGSSAWAVVNNNNQVRAFYSAKWIAKAEAELLNEA